MHHCLSFDVRDQINVQGLLRAMCRQISISPKVPACPQSLAFRSGSPNNRDSLSTTLHPALKGEGEYVLLFFLRYVLGHVCFIREDSRGSDYRKHGGERGDDTQQRVQAGFGPRKLRLHGTVCALAQAQGHLAITIEMKSNGNETDAYISLPQTLADTGICYLGEP